MHRVAWEFSVTFYVRDEQHLVNTCDINISFTVPATQQMISSSAQKANSSENCAPTSLGFFFKAVHVFVATSCLQIFLLWITHAHVMSTKCQSPRCIFSGSVHSYFLTLIQHSYYFHYCVRHAISFNSHPATVMFMQTASCIGCIIVPHLTGCIKRPGLGSLR